MYVPADRYHGDGATNWREILHMDPGQVLFSPFGGGYPQVAPKSEISIAIISKTLSRSVTCQMWRNIGSTRAFQKCITWTVALSPL